MLLDEMGAPSGSLENILDGVLPHPPSGRLPQLVTLHPGDIVEAIDANGSPYPVRLDVGNDAGQAYGTSMMPSGGALRGITIYFSRGDRLVACGRDEDCRNHLDLAIACARARYAESSPNLSTKKER